MKIRDILAVLIPLPFLLGAVRDSKAEMACFRDCHHCLRECRDASDKGTCREQCFAMKRQCCRGCGTSGGPRRSCTCR